MERPELFVYRATLLSKLSLNNLISAKLPPVLLVSLRSSKQKNIWKRDRKMSVSKKKNTSLLTRMRIGLAGLAGLYTMITAGLIALSGAAHSASYGTFSNSSENTVAIILIGALFCVTAVLSWAFMNHLADAASGTTRRRRS